MVSLCGSISKWLTVLVTLHRFIAVCVPHKAAAHCTKSKALKHVSTIITSPLHWIVISLEREVMRIEHSKKYYALLQVLAVVIINVAYCLPFFLDKQLQKIKNEDNSTSLVRSNSALGNSNVYQWFYKTILFYVIMYGMPLIVLAVFTGFLLRALAKARISRERMTGQNVSFFFQYNNR